MLSSGRPSFPLAVRSQRVLPLPPLYACTIRHLPIAIVLGTMESPVEPMRMVDGGALAATAARISSKPRNASCR
eukprot:scaffold293477_cov28-Tisochrysis_lutea.AAC.2